MVTINTLCSMIGMGMGSAVNTCVGNALGAGDGQEAKRCGGDEASPVNCQCQPPDDCQLPTTSLHGLTPASFRWLLHRFSLPSTSHRMAITGLALALAVEGAVVSSVSLFGEDMVRVAPRGS